MKDLVEITRLLGDRREELAVRFGVVRVAVFGSYARSEQTPASDIDIMIEFDRPIGWEIVDLKRYLEETLSLRVDLTTPGALTRKPRLWQTVSRELVYV